MPYKEGVTYDELIAYFGSQAAAAKAFGIQQPSVAEWKRRGVPETRQLEAEKLTSGDLKAHPRIKAKYRALLRSAA